MITRGNASLFVNGVRNASKTLLTDIVYYSPNQIKNNASRSNFYTGRFVDSDEDHAFIGSIDEVRVWSYARSDAQIAENFNKTVATPQDGLELYIDFNDPSGCSIVHDKSGHNRHGINSFAQIVPSTDLWGKSGEALGRVVYIVFDM